MEGLAPWRIVHLASCASTNAEVKRAIDEGEPAGLVVRADKQTGGYGRRGTTWESPAGGLYLSCLLRPKCLDVPVKASQLSTIGLVCGVVVRRAIVDALGEQGASCVKLKWPNDVVVEEIAPCSDRSFALNKICGISQEAYRGSLCIGIGVNVHHPRRDSGTGGEASRQDARNRHVYLDDLACESLDIDVICQKVLKHFRDAYRIWNEDGFEPFRREYERNLALFGEMVQLIDGEDVLGTGCIRGIDDAGALLLGDEGGSHASAFLSGHMIIGNVDLASSDSKEAL